MFKINKSIIIRGEKDKEEFFFFINLEFNINGCILIFDAYELADVEWNVLLTDNGIISKLTDSYGSHCDNGHATIV